MSARLGREEYETRLAAAQKEFLRLRLHLGGQTNDGKILLRNVLGRYVPHNYANGIKQGFSAPDASWFKGESMDYVRNLLYNKDARIYEYLQPKPAMRRIEDHLSGKQNNRLFIWSLLSFEWWLKTFMP